MPQNPSNFFEFLCRKSRWSSCCAIRLAVRNSTEVPILRACAMPEREQELLMCCTHVRPVWQHGGCLFKNALMDVQIVLTMQYDVPGSFRLGRASYITCMHSICGPRLRMTLQEPCRNLKASVTASVGGNVGYLSRATSMLVICDPLATNSPVWALLVRPIRVEKEPVVPIHDLDKSCLNAALLEMSLLLFLYVLLLMPPCRTSASSA